MPCHAMQPPSGMTKNRVAVQKPPFPYVLIHSTRQSVSQSMRPSADDVRNKTDSLIVCVCMYVCAYVRMASTRTWGKWLNASA